MPTINSLVSKQASSEHIGMTLGASQSISGLGRVVGPTWGGALFALGFKVPFLLTALILCVMCGVGIFIQKINQRLKDLLAEVVSDMKSNMTFLAPLLAGIVVGLASMITTILNKLQSLQSSATPETVSGLGNISSITSIFDINSMIPPYFVQVIIGLYLIEIIFILTYALTTLDAGKDTLREKYNLSKNLKIGISVYIGTALLSILALSLLSSLVLGGFG
jgi:hypothetical protein